MSRLLAASAMSLICAGPVAASVLDFEGLSAGSFVGAFTIDGVGVTVFGESNDFERPGGLSEAMIFDTFNPTGGDPDLVPDNSDSIAGPIDASLTGNVLILTEDGDAGDPDDAAGGGTFTFAFDRAVTLVSIDLIDDLSGTITATGFSQGFALTRENQLERAVFNWAGIDSFTVELDGSGALDNVVFEVSQIPVPAALPLLAGGMGALAFLRGRRRG